MRGHGRSLSVAAPTTFLRRDEYDRPDKHRPSGSDPRSGQPFLREWETPRPAEAVNGTPQGLVLGPILVVIHVND